MTRDIISENNELLSAIEKKEKEIQALTEKLSSQSEIIDKKDSEILVLKNRLKTIEKSQGAVSWFINDSQRQKKRVEGLIFRMKILMEIMNEGVIIIAGNGQIIQTNKAAENILQIDHSEIECRTIMSQAWQIFRQDKTPLSSSEILQYLNQFGNNQVRNFTVGIKVNHDEIVWLNISTSPLLINGSSEGIIGVFSDISKSYENKLIENSKLSNLNRRLIELETIQKISEVVNNPKNDLEMVLSEIPVLIHNALQNRESKGVLLIYNGKKYKTANCKSDKYRKSKYININGIRSGSLMICYKNITDKNNIDSNFETEYLSIMADTIGDIIEKKKHAILFRENQKNFEDIIHKRTEDVLFVNEKLQREIDKGNEREQILHESEARIKTLLNKSRQGFVLVSAEYKIMIFNKLANDVSQKTIGKNLAIDLDFREFVPKEDWVQFNMIFNEAIKGKSRSYSQSFRGVDNKIYWYSYDYNPVRMSKGRIVGICIGILDITEHKAIEQKLSNAQQHIRSLMEASLDPLVMINPDGKISDVNDAVCKITGIKRDNLISTDFANYFDDPSKVHATYAEVFKHGMIKDYELDIKSIDGSVTPVLYNASFFRNASDEIQGVFVAARNISEIKQEQEKREKLILELQDAISNVKQLQELLPICASCKKIRDDKGYWHQVEEYLNKKNDMLFSHSICPDCARELYPEMFKDGKDPFANIEYDVED